MEISYSQFLQDIQNNYVDGNLTSSEQKGIIVKVENRELLFPNSELYRRFNEFKLSGLPYSEWVSRTTSYIKKETQKWKKSWN